MIIVSVIAVLLALAWPKINDTLRTFKSREGARAIVNAVLGAKASAALQGVDYLVRLTPSTAVGTSTPGGGGDVKVYPCSRKGVCGTDCLNDITLGNVKAADSFLFESLKTISLCLISTTAAPAVTTATACQTTAVDLCVSPDGTVTNQTTPTAPFTLAYIRENEVSGASVTGAGVIRQVVLPQRKTIQVNTLQVVDDTCL